MLVLVSLGLMAGVKQARRLGDGVVELVQGLWREDHPLVAQI
jgi:hypothetical protein